MIQYEYTIDSPGTERKLNNISKLKEQNRTYCKKQKSRRNTE